MSGSQGRGLIVTVAGPDGAGKSTLCDALTREFSMTRPVLRLHGRPHILPGRAAGIVTDPHRAEPHGRLLSATKVIYVFCDFVLGWLLRLRPFVRRGGLVIMERGWWDMMIDPRRYRLRVPPGLVGLLGRLQPVRGILLVLEAPAELLARRKSELTESETARQILKWRELSLPGAMVVFLDASRELDELVPVAMREIERRFAATPDANGLR